MKISVTVNKEGTMVRVDVLTENWDPGTDEIALSLKNDSLAIDVNYQLSSAEKALLVSQKYIYLASSVFAGVGSYFPDDFYSVRMLQYAAATPTVIVDQSDVMYMATFSRIQAKAYAMIVESDRQVGSPVIQRFHSIFIQVRALEVLGNNPSVILKDTFKRRMLYLNSAVRV